MSFIRALTVFFLIASVQGYCVYNQAPDVNIAVSQIEGYGCPDLRRFHKYIGPSNKECCPYTSSDCCDSTSKDGVVKFNVMKYTGWGNTWQNPIEFNAPCGGYVVVHGSNVKPEIQVYYADGKPYSTDLQYTMHMIGAGKVHGNHTANSTVTEQAPSNRTLPPTVIGVPVNETLNSSAIAQVPGNRTLNNPFGQVPTSNNTHNSTTF